MLPTLFTIYYEDMLFQPFTELKKLAVTSIDFSLLHYERVDYFPG